MFLAYDVILAVTANHSIFPNDGLPNVPRSMKVVIVDGNPTRSEAIRQGFESAANYLVCADCFSAIEAVHAIQRHRPDIVVMNTDLFKSEHYPMLESALRQSKTVLAIPKESVGPIMPIFFLGGRSYETLDSLLVSLKNSSENESSTSGRRVALVDIEPVRAHSSRKIALRTDRGVELVATATIERIEKIGDQTSVFVRGRCIVTNYTVKAFSILLSRRKQFVHLNPKLILNVYSIARVDLGISPQVHLVDGSRYVVGTAKARALIRKITLIVGPILPK